MRAQLVARADPSRPKFPFYAFLDFKGAKSELDEDGCLLIRDVVGTSETLDRDGEVVDYESAKAAMGDYMNRTGHGTGPLRRGHGGDSGGRVVGWRADDAGKRILIDLKIMGQDAITLCRNGGYTGVSIAFRRAFKDRNRLIVKRIGEWALVDAEANPDSALPIGKSWDTDAKGLGMVQYFVGCLANLIAVREAVTNEKLVEGDQSKLPEMLDEIVQRGAEAAREMFDEEIAEAIGDDGEDDSEQGLKALSELVGQIDAKAARLGKSYDVLKAAADAARVSFDQARKSLAAKRQKEAPVAGETQEQLDEKAIKEAAAGMTADHKRHAKALTNLHGGASDAHKAMGDALKTHQGAMHPDVHKALSDHHKAMGGHIKEAGPHAAHAAKMLGHKKALDGGVEYVLPAGEPTGDDVAKAIRDAVAAELGSRDAKHAEELKALQDKLSALEGAPAVHPVTGPGVRVAPGKGQPTVAGSGEISRELDTKITALAKIDPRIGESIFKDLYSAVLTERPELVVGGGQGGK